VRKGLCSAFGNCKWRFVNTIAPWQTQVRHFLRNSQRYGAFIAAFTSEKRWMTIKNKFRNWKFLPNIFSAHLPILVRCKTKGAIRAVCDLLGNWQLGV
jgi:hypothetical protein